MNKRIKIAQARQGDVWIEKIDKIPGSAKKRTMGANEPVVLAFGEVTGHAHRVLTPGVEMFDEGEFSFLHSDEPFSVTHEEHSPINLEAGDYKTWIQREYSPEEIRKVAD